MTCEETERATLVARSRAYMEAQIADVNLPVDPADIELTIDGRLTAAHGNCGPDGDGYLIKLSPHSFERFGWEGPDGLKETIRHELIHVWQYEEYGTMDHGVTFEEYMSRLNVVSKRAARRPAPPRQTRYVVKCPNCTQGRWYRKIKSTVVKEASERCCPYCETWGLEVENLREGETDDR